MAAIKKVPNPVDVEIGKRIRAQRLLLGISQEQLANKIDVTFQQVQKYEKGTNRVSGSRMVQVAKALGVSIATLHGEGNTDPLKGVANFDANDIELVRSVSNLPAKGKRALIALCSVLRSDPSLR